MANKMLVVMSNVVLVMSKITDHKLNGRNYLDWSKAGRFYMRSIDTDGYMVKSPLIDDSRQQWLREDACLFLQI